MSDLPKLLLRTKDELIQYFFYMGGWDVIRTSVGGGHIVAVDDVTPELLMELKELLK